MIYKVVYLYAIYGEKKILKNIVSYPSIIPLIFMSLFVFQKHAKGQDLFDQIVYHLDLVETDYFGLQFLDSAQVTVRLAGIHFENDWLFTLTAVPQARHTDGERVKPRWSARDELGRWCWCPNEMHAGCLSAPPTLEVATDQEAVPECLPETWLNTGWGGHTIGAPLM